MPDLYVTWSEYHKNIETLAITIYQSGWEFNQIVCLAKGGLRVGDILCRLFRQPLAVLCASSYGGKDNQIRGKLIFSEHLSMTTPTLGDRVLLVDDLADSGVTLGEGINWLKNRYPIQEIRTGVIWHKACSIIKPDYSAQYLPDSPWIHQPFEIYEQITAAQLADRYQNS
ncbi:phosphoribosyltransferase [Gloeothece citriformis PCC 7424]|uniref:Phosphoribosyltransferase n=1 Tax=Gloeothece citriformis (strain PCC 7424) TaxID=65393 RepID=B7KAJ8_GLOC7|nr:phosphoribosyltransferase [Gloeothece citriformis]ACK68670.1 phosphoribosyltransferase [Gloeothece citriformis PCC 7424]